MTEHNVHPVADDKTSLRMTRGYNYNQPGVRHGRHLEDRRTKWKTLLMLIVGLAIVAFLVYLSITK